MPRKQRKKEEKKQGNKEGKRKEKWTESVLGEEDRRQEERRIGLYNWM